MFIVSEWTVGRKMINVGKQQLQGSVKSVTFIQTIINE
jgi:hypothetical protein